MDDTKKAACQGTTKAGNPCKMRKAVMPNGFCAQHQGQAEFPEVIGPNDEIDILDSGTAWPDSLDVGTDPDTSQDGNWKAPEGLEKALSTTVNTEHPVVKRSSDRATEIAQLTAARELVALYISHKQVYRMFDALKRFCEGASIPMPTTRKALSDHMSRVLVGFGPKANQKDRLNGLLAQTADKKPVDPRAVYRLFDTLVPKPQEADGEPAGGKVDSDSPAVRPSAPRPELTAREIEEYEEFLRFKAFQKARK